MNHDAFCLLGTNKAHVDAADCQSCAYVDRIREDERQSFSRDKETLAYEVAMLDAIHVLERLWEGSWCSLRYATCDDNDHACRYRREEVQALRNLSRTQGQEQP